MVRSLTHDEISALHLELKLKDIMAAAEKLPPFPDVVWKVMTLIRKTAPVSEIEAAIKYDQALASRVLALSQSAYFGRRSGVKSLHDAILVVGSQRLIQTIMTVCSARYFQPQGRKQDARETELWQHSVSTAIMGETIARRLKQKRALSIYTAALLHDVGKTVLEMYVRTYIGSVIDRMRRQGMSFLGAERKALGVDHQELGEIIARRWRFPAEVIAGIAHHHFPEKADDYQDVACVVYMANRISTIMEPGQGTDVSFNPEQDPVFLRFGINTDMMARLQEETSEAMDGVNKFLTH